MLRHSILVHWNSEQVKYYWWLRIETTHVLSAKLKFAVPQDRDKWLSHCFRSAPSSTSFPKPAQATSLVSSLRPQIRVSKGTKSSCIPVLVSAAVSHWGQVKMLSSGKGVVGKASTELGRMHQLWCVATSYWEWKHCWACCLGLFLSFVHRGSPGMVTLCLIWSPSCCRYEETGRWRLYFYYIWYRWALVKTSRRAHVPRSFADKVDIASICKMGYFKEL